MISSDIISNISIQLGVVVSEGIEYFSEMMTYGVCSVLGVGGCVHIHMSVECVHVHTCLSIRHNHYTAHTTTMLEVKYSEDMWEQSINSSVIATYQHYG